MNTIVMLLLVLAAAAAQTVQPVFAFMGQAKAPFLLCVALYYALRRDMLLMLLAALLAGLVQDGASLAPLGVTAFCFAAVAWGASRFGGIVSREHPLSISLIGGASGGIATLLVWGWLRWNGSVRYGLGWGLTKAFWTTILGMWTAPLVYVAASGLDRFVGNIATRESANGLE